ncbi:MAG: thioredoxin family protein [Chitinophagia bacterium]|jgi:thioredoxin-related protein
MKPAITILFIFLYVKLHANDSLYHPKANARQDIAAAIAKAKSENKHVFIQAGGNWCGWCIEFNRMVAVSSLLNKIIQENYIVYHLNYSQENKNASIFSEYGFPNRFGFPVFIILDSNGKRIHTQNSSYLESGKSYDIEKVKEFLNSWTPRALQATSYPYLN